MTYGHNRILAARQSQSKCYEIGSMCKDLIEAGVVQDYRHTSMRLYVRSIPRNAVAELNGICVEK